MIACPIHYFSSGLDGYKSIENDSKSDCLKTLTRDYNLQNVQQILSKNPNVTCRMLTEESLNSKSRRIWDVNFL